MYYRIVSWCSLVSLLDKHDYSNFFIDITNITNSFMLRINIDKILHKVMVLDFDSLSCCGFIFVAHEGII